MTDDNKKLSAKERKQNVFQQRKASREKAKKDKETKMVQRRFERDNKDNQDWTELYNLYCQSKNIFIPVTKLINEVNLRIQNGEVAMFLRDAEREDLKAEINILKRDVLAYIPEFNAIYETHKDRRGHADIDTYVNEIMPKAEKYAAFVDQYTNTVKHSYDHIVDILYLISDRKRAYQAIQSGELIADKDGKLIKNPLFNGEDMYKDISDTTADIEDAQFKEI